VCRPAQYFHGHKHVVKEGLKQLKETGMDYFGFPKDALGGSQPSYPGKAARACSQTLADLIDIVLVFTAAEG
jgi:hypothetical protein